MSNKLISKRVILSYELEPLTDSYGVVKSHSHQGVTYFLCFLAKQTPTHLLKGRRFIVAIPAPLWLDAPEVDNTGVP